LHQGLHRRQAIRFLPRVNDPYLDGRNSAYRAIDYPPTPSQRQYRNSQGLVLAKSLSSLGQPTITDEASLVIRSARLRGASNCLAVASFRATKIFVRSLVGTVSSMESIWILSCGSSDGDRQNKEQDFSYAMRRCFAVLYSAWTI
jgi:hypothetical protein